MYGTRMTDTTQYLDTTKMYDYCVKFASNISSIKAWLSLYKNWIIVGRIIDVIIIAMDQSLMISQPSDKATGI